MVSPHFQCLDCGHDFDCNPGDNCVLGELKCPRCGSVRLERQRFQFGAKRGDEITGEEYLTALPYFSL